MKFAAIGAALALSLLGPVALAQPQPQQPSAPEQSQSAGQADVLVLHATNAGTGIGDKIKQLPYELPQLLKPPLSAYDTYTLLDNKKLGLELSKAKNMTLPGNSVLAVKLDKVKPPKKPQGKKRYALSTSVTKPDGNKPVSMKVTAPPKVFFFVAGPSYKDGILVIGIRVLPN